MSLFKRTRKGTTEQYQYYNKRKMGISKSDCRLLFYSKKLNVDFENTLTLGRLQLRVAKEDLRRYMIKYYSKQINVEDVKFPDEFAEPLFKILGAKYVESIDYSPYQKATIIHDLNYPVAEENHNRFSCIVDGGTLEHVFNFPAAIKNCMNMLKTGGHYIGISPANNQMGHGFYQLSPELYYRIFSEENGFEVKKMFVTVSGNDETEWFEVADPKNVHSRVTLVNNVPLSLMIIAEKKSDKEVFLTMPQ
ncbi:MAG: hypothetical protein JJE25_06505, partial [Bacteroidia bacterium]|nr:hypothetical protein [Bacteroidia bacterium]